MSKDSDKEKMYNSFAEMVIRTATQMLGERIGNQLTTFPFPVEFSLVIFTPVPLPDEREKLVVIYSSGSVEQVADVFGRIGDDLREDLAQAADVTDAALAKAKEGNGGL